MKDKIRINLGNLYYKQGDYQEALNQWYNVLLIKKDDPALNLKTPKKLFQFISKLQDKLSIDIFLNKLNILYFLS